MDTVSILKMADDHWATRALTPGERGVLWALEQAVERYGNPSLREIAACAVVTCYSLPSVPMIHAYLRRLEAKGFVRLPLRRQARSIKLVRRGDER